MKLLFGLFIVALAADTVYSAKVFIKSAPDPNAALFEDTNFIYSTDVKDGKAPTIYKGDPRTAHVTDAFNERTRDRFHNAYGTVNGIEVESVGKLKETETGKAFVVSGSYSYTGADGRRYRVRYTADEFGYHPKTELELDFPEINENNRVGRTHDSDSKLQRFSARDNTPKVVAPKYTPPPTKSSNGYNYERPLDRLYLPPV